MAAVASKALREQLCAIMGALTKAAVAEICGLVDEGYAVLQMEISRSHKENEDLKKKLQQIESIVVRGAGGGGGAEVVPAAQEELPEVVLIKDEDSDSNDNGDEEHQTPAASSAAASTPSGRGRKRYRPRSEEAEQPAVRTSKPAAGVQHSVTVYSVDSPRSDEGCCSARLDEMEAGESLCSYSARADPDVHLVQECSLAPPSATAHSYFGSSAPTEAPPDADLAWTQRSKGHVSFGQFHPDEPADGDDLGIKLVSVSGSTSTDCQVSESSSSAFEYDDADLMNFVLYRDPSGRTGKRFVCSICSKTYATSQNLDVHMRIHTGERPFSCHQCGKKFTQSAHLKSHLSVHSGERPHTCTVCSRSFIVKYSLKLHMKKCHPNV